MGARACGYRSSTRTRATTRCVTVPPVAREGSKSAIFVPSPTETTIHDTIVSAFFYELAEILTWHVVERSGIWDHRSRELFSESIEESSTHDPGRSFVPTSQHSPRAHESPRRDISSSPHRSTQPSKIVSVFSGMDKNRVGSAHKAR